MGNHRFRLSDMIPNAWFYKLKDMGTRSTTKSQKKKHPLPPPPPPIGATSLPSPPQPPKPHRHLHLHHQLHPRQSYHFTRDDSPPDPFHYNLAPSHLPDPPRKSAKKRKSTNKIKTNYSKMSNSPRLVTTSVSADCSCRASLESVWTKPDSTTEEYPNSTSSENESLFNMPSWSPPYTPCSCNHKSENVDQQKFETPDLPPIITKKTEPTRIRKTTTKIEARNYANGSLSVKVAKEDNIVGISQKEQRSTPPLKKFSGGSSPGMKLRTNSPRIGTRKVHHINHRKSVSSIPTSGGSRRSDGFAVVKSSRDPHRDFKESMVEMIMQNEIKASKDLEDLLACYLSLNSDEYHDMIIKVFKQIWFDTVHIRLN